MKAMAARWELPLAQCRVLLPPTPHSAASERGAHLCYVLPLYFSYLICSMKGYLELIEIAPKQAHGKISYNDDSPPWCCVCHKEPILHNDYRSSACALHHSWTACWNMNPWSWSCVCMGSRSSGGGSGRGACALGPIIDYSLDLISCT